MGTASRLHLLPRVTALAVLSALLIPARAQPQEPNRPPTHVSYRLLDAGPIRIPFELYNGEIRFSCELNGRPVRMLLDDGFMWDELQLWGSDLSALGLRYTRELPPIGSTGGPPSKLAEGITLRLPGIEFTNETAIVSPPGSWYERAFAGSVGQVSGTFLKGFAVSIDFDEMVITLTPPETFHYTGGGRAVPWEPLGFGPWGIPVTLGLPGGRRVEMRVLLDLGYNDQLQIVTADSHALAMPDTTLVTNVVRGTGRAETFYLGRLPSLTMGGYQVENVLASFLAPRHTTMVFSEAMLGLNLLSRFNLVYDYRDRLIYLQPNRRFREPFEYTMTGFSVRQREGGVHEIIQIHRGSPADSAGLAAGDLVVRVNGRPVGDFGPAELSALWRQAGAIVDLEVSRGGVTREVRLRLRRLI